MRHTKAITLALIFLCITVHSVAQDHIFLKSGEQINGKVKEITSNEVKYTLQDDQNKTFYYVLKKKHISKIEFENGDTQNFGNHKKTTTNGNMGMEYQQNLLYFHLFDILYNDFTISYERILKNGNLSLYCPVGIGFNTNEYYAYGDYSNLFYSGIGLNFYPSGQNTWSYFVGPSLRLGKFITSYYQWDDIDLSGWEENQKGVYAKCMIGNGIIYSPVNDFSVSAIASIGIKYFDTDINNYTPKGTYSAGHFSINLAYRF